MKDFEGVKRIKNVNSVTIENLYEVLSNYKKAIGELKISEDNTRLFADTEGKYYIDIYLNKEFIVLERKLENGFEKNEENEYGEGLKSVDMSIADRMIEQIYDFLIDFLDNDGNVSEFITGVKKVLTVKQEESTFSNIYKIYDADNKLTHQMKDSKFMKEIVIRDLVSKRELATVKYSDIANNRFCIIKPPYTTIYLLKNTAENKTTFVGTINNDELKIKADYTDNHYLIELDDIVIGAVDSLDDVKQNKYRIEINDLEYEYLILSIAAIIDFYLEKEKNEKMKNK